MEVLCSLLLGQRSVFLLPALLAFSYFVVYSPDFSLSLCVERCRFSLFSRTVVIVGAFRCYYVLVCAHYQISQKKEREEKKTVEFCQRGFCGCSSFFFFFGVCACTFLETRCSTVFRFFLLSLILRCFSRTICQTLFFFICFSPTLLFPFATFSSRFFF